MSAAPGTSARGGPIAACRHVDRVATRCAQLATVLFLLVSKLTGKTGSGLVASCATIFLLCIKNGLAAETMGIEKPGIYFWGVVQAAIAFFGYTAA